MSATLFVPSLGTPQARVSQESDTTAYRLDVRPVRMRLVYNGPHEADECELTLAFDESGVDPRYLRSAIVYAYMDDCAGTAGVLTPDLGTNCRFIGMAVDVTREFNESGGKVVTIRAQDYTSLFINCHTYPASKWPTYSDTLQSAWAKICANTGFWDLSTGTIQSTVDVLTDQISFIGCNGSDPLGPAMPERLAGLATFQAGRPGSSQADSWAIWKTVCESLGLITFIRGDRCIVTTATDFYTANDPPLFVYGQNIHTLKETRELGALSSSGVCARSYDPLTGKSLESLYPPPGQALKVKRLGAAPKAPSAHAHAGTGGKTVRTENYDPFDLPFAVASQTQLDTIALRIWQERVRQELHGSLTTREMVVQTVGGSPYTLLPAVCADPSDIENNPNQLAGLQAGDAMAIEIKGEALDYVQGLDSVGDRIQALVLRGYAEDMATLIAQNLDSITKLPGQFITHSTEFTFDCSSPDGNGTYNVDVHFLNRVSLTGDGSVTTQLPEAPVAGTPE